MKAKMKCAKNDFRLWNDKERALSKFTAIWIVSTLTMKLGLKQMFLVLHNGFSSAHILKYATLWGSYILCISSLCLSINFYGSSINSYASILSFFLFIPFHFLIPNLLLFSTYPTESVSNHFGMITVYLKN